MRNCLSQNICFTSKKIQILFRQYSDLGLPSSVHSLTIVKSILIHELELLNGSANNYLFFLKKTDNFFTFCLEIVWGFLFFFRFFYKFLERGKHAESII